MTTSFSNSHAESWNGAPPTGDVRNAVAAIIALEEEKSPNLSQADLVLFEYNCLRDDIAGAPTVAALGIEDARAIYFAGRADPGESWAAFKARQEPGVVIDAQLTMANATPATTDHAESVALDFMARLRAEEETRKQAAAKVAADIIDARKKRIDAIRSAAATPPEDEALGDDDPERDAKTENFLKAVLDTKRRQDLAEQSELSSFPDVVSEELRRQLRGNETRFRELSREFIRRWKTQAEIPDVNTLAVSDAVGLRFIDDWPEEQGPYSMKPSYTWPMHLAASNRRADDLAEFETSPSFPLSLVAALKDGLNVVMNDGQIEQTRYEYAVMRRRYPQQLAPIDSLSATDAAGVHAVTNFDGENETWSEHCVRQDRRNEAFANASDPFMPGWISKTDDRPNPWVTATGLAPENQQERNAFDKVFKQVKPVASSESPFELIGIAPATESLMTFLAGAIDRSIPILAKTMGIPGDDSTSEFRTAPALVILAGLGLPTLRRIAQKIADKDGDAIWGHYAMANDGVLRDEIVQARAMSGYPISLLRAPYVSLERVCTQRPDNLPSLAPRWLPAVLIMHLYKHVRLRRNFKGKPTLWISYDGQYSHVAFSPEGMDQRLTDGINRELKKSICSILKIRQVRTGAREAIDDLIDSTLSHVHPADFAQLNPLRSVPRLVVPKAVTIISDPVHPTMAPWVNHGLSVLGLYHINRAKNGSVEPTTISGAMVTMLDWPQANMTSAEMHVFKSILPETVKPALPSSILSLYFRNVNGLGHLDGYHALINGTFCGNVMRDELAGSPAGNLMCNEYPLLPIMPTGFTKQTTTNQGKTFLARTFGNIFVQGLPVTQAGRSASPPAQRAMVSPIERFGTAIYDEFVLPINDEHCLAQAGLQMLLTGGVITPGRANENSEGVSLKFPLAVTCKCAYWPPDLITRSIPSFMDILTKETRSSNSDLTKILSGALAMEIKLSMMLWIEETNFVERARAAGIVGGIHRFDGHATLALLLCAEGKQDEIREYISAAEQQCAEQAAAAADSGLLDGMGIGPQFDPSWYFREATTETLIDIQKATLDGPMNIQTFMRQLIGNRNQRTFDSVVGPYPRTPERRAQGAFSEALSEGKLVRSDGWYAKQGSIKYPKIGARRSVIVARNPGADPEGESCPTLDPRDGANAAS